jgi:hypothetical protein
MTSSPHPIEGVYEAREALDRALAAQVQSNIAQLDWPAYGSGLLGVLSSLTNLADVLVDQIDQTDRDQLYRDALRDHPHEALDRAVAHLTDMRRVLSTAIHEARGYWEEAQHIHDDTTHRPEDGD